MKVLLDHNVPHAFRLHLNHEVHSAAHMGWGDLDNGDLIKAAEEAAFSVLITFDANLRFQQNTEAFILDIHPVFLPNLIEIAPAIEEALPRAAAGRTIVIA